jgi:hypothetical protein
MSKCPAPIRSLAERSRLAGLAETLFLYGLSPREAPFLDGVPGRLKMFMDKHPKTSLLVLTLTKDDPLDGMAPRGNFLHFSLGKIAEPFLSWNGLTPGGHKILAKTIYLVLQKNKDRLKPSAGITAHP